MAGHKIVGANHHTFLRQRVLAVAHIIVEILGVENFIGDAELVGQLKAPLFAQGGRAHNNDFAFAHCPILAQHKSGLDGLAQTYLVGKYHSFR